MKYSKSHCALTYNNVLMDASIKGYMTINVEGRQLIAPNIKNVDVPGRNGDVVLSQQYPARDIIVHFLLQERNNYYFLERIKELTHYLHTDIDVPFGFEDEDGVRFGRLANIDDPPYDSNVGIGKFTIHCQDPFLYKELKTSSGVIPKLNYKKYPIKIESINITTTATNKVVIKNETRGTNIVLNGTFNNGDNLVVSKDNITVNNQNRMNWLDFVESEYQHFQAYAEDVISVNAGTLEINYRERIL